MPKPLSHVDKIRDSIEAQRQGVRHELRSFLAQMDPHEFEELVVKLLERMNFIECEVTQRSKDGGIDLRANFSIGIGKINTIGQVKRYKASIGAQALQMFYGAMTAHKGHEEVHLGLFVTTSAFSAPATKWVQDSALPMVLVDGEKLADLLIEHGLLVEAVPMLPALRLAVDSESPVLPEPDEKPPSAGGKRLFRWKAGVSGQTGSFVLIGEYLPDPNHRIKAEGVRVPPEGDFKPARAQLQAEIVSQMAAIFPKLDKVHLSARAWSGTHKVYPADVYGK